MSKANKPLFVGEFGVSAKADADAEKKEFEQLLLSLVELDVPLAADWVYDYSRMEGQWNTTFKNSRAYMLEMISKANRRIVEIQ